jgi:hypothetical protein
VKPAVTYSNPWNPVKITASRTVIIWAFWVSILLPMNKRNEPNAARCKPVLRPRQAQRCYMHASFAPHRHCSLMNDYLNANQPVECTCSTQRQNAAVIIAVITMQPDATCCIVGARVPPFSPPSVNQCCKRFSSSIQDKVNDAQEGGLPVRAYAAESLDHYNASNSRSTHV